MTVQATQAAKEAADQIRKLIEERANGGANRLDEALAIAETFGIEKDWVREGFQQAEQGLREATTAKTAAAKPVKAAAKTVTVPAVAKIVEVKKGEVKKKAEGVALRGWSEVAVPTSANEVEALTYVPGLIGDIVEWIVKGAKRPNRMMALGTALVVGGTLLAQRVRGPTDSGTHVYVIIIAPTGYGKDWPLVCGTRLIEELGLDELLGPSEWASSPGIWKRLRRNPVLICFVDELGDELALVNCQGGNPFVNKVIGALKKCYNAFSTQMTAEKVGEESEKIMWRSPSIIGASTAEKFYGSITPSDLESGFANRLLILPLMGQRPAEQLTARNASDPPKELVNELRKLWLPFDWADYPRPRQTLLIGDQGQAKSIKCSVGKWIVGNTLTQ
jgi:hypothetical protein